MGEVYRARDSRLARDVAIKVLAQLVSTDPERLYRFEIEARRGRAGSSQHSCGVPDGNLCRRSLPWELLDGRL
jgi:hypothetical protein